MSILAEYEEISLEDFSTDNSEKIKQKQPKPPCQQNKQLVKKLENFKSNPNTFDFENFLHDMKRPKKLSSNTSPVVERILFSHQISQNKIRFQRQEKEFEEIKACTFRPKILGKRRTRSFKEFYEQQQDFVVKKLEKINEIKKKIGDNEKRLLENEQILMIGNEKNEPKKLRIIKKGKNNQTNPLHQTVALSQGIFKKMGKPPLPLHN